MTLRRPRESHVGPEWRLATGYAFAVDQAEGCGADGPNVVLGGRQGGVRADAAPGARPRVCPMPMASVAVASEAAVMAGAKVPTARMPLQAARVPARVVLAALVADAGVKAAGLGAVTARRPWARRWAGLPRVTDAPSAGANDAQAQRHNADSEAMRSSRTEVTCPVSARSRSYSECCRPVGWHLEGCRPARPTCLESRRAQSAVPTEGAVTKRSPVGSR